MTGRPRALLAMSPGVRRMLFGAGELARLETLVDVGEAVPVTRWNDVARDDLAATEYVIGGWGAPLLDATALDAMPRLRGFVHTGGSVKEYVAPEVWSRGVVVTSAVDANALPVAEYALAAILVTGKRLTEVAGRFAATRHLENPTPRYPDMGNFRKTVGIVGASRVGRRVLELLRPFDFDVILADPTLDAGAAALLGARLVDLDELVDRADVVSIHAPHLPETENLFDADRIARLRTGAALINTARGVLVDHDALVSRLAAGEIVAVLDVTEPERLPADHPLWDLPNAILTPHVAGSQGNEHRRLVASALDELELLLDGRAPRAAVAVESLGLIA